MLSHRRLHRLLKRLRAMPQERMVLVAFIIMNHTTRAHTRLIHEERIQYLSSNIAGIIKHKSDGIYSA